MSSRSTRPRARRAPARFLSARTATRGVVVPAAALLALSLTAAPSPGGLRIIDQGVRVDTTRRTAAFFARFDAPPDLFTRDEFGRLADSFQYEIDADGPVAPDDLVGPVEAVVRGDEIFDAGALRVRAAGPDVRPDPDPLSGGWGPVRAAVPFDLNGPDLSFAVPLAALGDDDGRFSYRLFTVEFGLTVDEVQGVAGPVPAVPLPPAIWPACATAGAFAWLALARRASRSRRHP